MKMNTKSKLISSLLVLVLCVTAFAGSTYAWFTDTVTSSGNKIQSGSLKVDLELLEADNLTWTSIKNAPQKLFDYQLWEPGYTEAVVLKVVNEGTLNLKWNAQLVSDDPIDMEFADVIDVYVKSGVTQNPTRQEVSGWTKEGTLKDFINNLETTTVGKLAPQGEATLGLAFKMQESADNEYQNRDLGGAFDIRIFATQDTVEEDSFGSDYDEKAPTPIANMTNLPEAALTVEMVGESSPITLDAGFQFTPTEEQDEVLEGNYSSWHADFVVSADKAVPADSLMLAGFYKAFCGDDTTKNWIGLTSPVDIAADQEIRLVESLPNNVTVNYSEIAQYGNDGTGFLCGIKNLDAYNVGTTITVELRLFETERATTSNNNTTNNETGKSIVIGTYTYTIE